MDRTRRSAIPRCERCIRGRPEDRATFPSDDGTEAQVLKEVTCLCGWVARGTDDEVVEQLTLHAWEDHGVRKTREEILANAVPIGPADASGL